MKLLKCILGFHKWEEKTWLRSCYKCNKVQETGYTTDEDDWHRPADTTMRKMLIGFLQKLKVTNVDRGI